MTGDKVYHPILIFVLTSLLALPAARAEIRISEIMVAGQTIIQDEDGAYPDWIEIENTGPAPVALNGWHLTDRVDLPNAWTFPAVSLPAGGHLVVFASGKNRAGAGSELHTSFSLRSGGEFLAITDSTGATVHALEYPVQIPDLSFDGVNFLANPTPGAPNDGTIVRIASAPQFSEPHGFKTAPINLTLTSATPGAAIHYTLDGTDPTESSALFGTAITIKRTTVVRAAAFAPDMRRSLVTTRTYLFIDDIVRQSPTGKAPKGFPKSWGENHVDYGMDPRITQRPPYRKTIKSDLQTIPSLSIVMDPADLFDAATGIYANPGEHGREWERPMSIELIQANGEPGFQINGGLRIRGGASRDTGNPKHSFRVLFRNEYGAPELKFPLFGPSGAKRTQKFDIRCEQLVAWHFFVDPEADFIRDIFGRDTQGALGQPYTRGDFHHLYINGQYWGLYQTDERVSAEYASEYFGGSEDDYDIVKFDADSDFGTGFIDGTFGAWRRLFDAGTAGFADNAAYFKVQGRHPDGTRNPAYERLLDVDNLIDYMLAGIFITVDDSPPSSGTQNNWYGVRSRKDDFGFRFFAHDWEISMSNAEENRVGPQPTSNPFDGQSPQNVNPWHLWEAMRFNAEFRLRVADRAQKYLFNGGPLTKEVAKARWHNRMEEIDRAVVGESARWGDARGGGSDGGGGPIFNDPGPIKKAADARVADPGPGPVIDDGGLIPRPGPGPGPEPGGGPGKHPKPFTRADWFKAANNRVLNGYLEIRSDRLLQHLIEGGLYPSLGAPVFTPHGGPLPAGQLVSIALPQSATGGEIYYTLDGSDPRKIGGAISDKAQRYAAPFPLAKRTVVKARALRGIDWSAIVEVEFVPGVDLSPLKITEIFYNPSLPGTPGTDDGEFLELKNTGSQPLDLSGLQFTTGITYEFPSGTTVNAGGFVVLVRNSAVFLANHPGFNPATVAHFGTYTGKLSDDGELLTLSTATGARVFSLEYNDRAPWPEGADGYGFSATYDGAGDPDDGRNWHVSSVPGGTPGADDQRPVFPQVVVNEVLTRSSTAPDAVELCNVGETPADISGWLLSNDTSVPAKFRIPPGTVIPPGEFLVFDATQLGFSFKAAGDAVWLFSATQTSPPTGYVHGWEFDAANEDVSFGRHVNSVGDEYFVAQSQTTLGSANANPLKPLVYISEIHYAPKTGDDEFIELRNAGMVPANLAGARVVGVNLVLPPTAQIPPGGFALIVSVDPAAFRTKYNVSAAVPIFGPAPGSLQDDGENVALELPVTIDAVAGFMTLDRVRYDNRRPWPVSAAGFGHSLQRLTADPLPPNLAAPLSATYGNEPRDWLGGAPTPGADNVVNAAPRVRLTSPRSGLVFRPPASVLMTANAADSDGQIAKVEFLVDQLVVGEDTQAPYEFTWLATPGLHDLSARAIDSGGASTESAPVTITVDAPANGTGLGLHGEYFNNPDLTGAPVAVRDDSQIDFDWAEVAPIEGLPREGFSVRWTGKIVPRVSGDHTFLVAVTGAVRLFVNGVLLIDHWQEPTEIITHQGIATLSGSLPASIRLEYADKDGFANVSLRWIEPGNFQDIPIPETQLYLPGQNPAALGIAMAGELPARRLGRSIRTDLIAANGTRPYSWAITSGNLPPGVILNASGSLSGSPAAIGIFRFRLQVTDASTATAQRDFVLRIVDDSAPRPVVDIVAPEPGATFGDGKVVVRGTAKSRRGIAEVRYSLNGGSWHLLPGRETWRVSLDSLRGLIGGQNLVSIVAIDTAGRESIETKRQFTRVIQRPLIVQIQGSGTVTPGFLGTTRRTVGQRYTIDATPAPGWVFREWSGQFFADPHLVFAMEEGLVLTAVFEPNPFQEADGQYAGFIGETLEQHDSRGTIALSLTKAGAFTGTLRFAGRAFPLKGNFGALGDFSKTINAGGDIGTLFLDLQFVKESKTIQVRINRDLDPGGTVESTGVAERSTWVRQNPCRFAATYSMNLPKPSPPAPQGDGSAQITIAPNGFARLTGKLGDGTAWTASARITDQGILPLYTPLYRSKGSISGPLTFVTQPALKGTGKLFWSKAEEFKALLDASAGLVP
jgi:hypothetical protein